MTTRMVWIRVARGLVVVLAVLATSGGSAWAAFPGRNGNIVYGWNAGSAYRASPVATSIRTVDPRTGRVRVLRDCAFLPGGLTDCTVWGPRYSPDGLRIAFPTIRIQLPIPDWIRPWQYWPGFGAIASDGSGFQEHAAGNTYSSLAWSPAGSRLLLPRLLTAPDSFAAGLLQADRRLPGRARRDRAQPSDLRRDLDPGLVHGRKIGSRARATTLPVPSARTSTWCVSAAPRQAYLPRCQRPCGRRTERSWHRPRGPRPRERRGKGHLHRRTGRHGLRRLARRGGYAPAWSPNGKSIAFIRAKDLYMARAAAEAPSPGQRPHADPLDPRGGFVTSVDSQPCHGPVDSSPPPPAVSGLAAPTLTTSGTI